MPIPTWSVGQVLAAADVNAWFVPQHAAKTATQSVTSSTTLVNDSDLVLPVASNAAYLLECQLYFTAGTGADMKWTWAVPAGASLLYQPLHNEGGGTGLANSTQANSDVDTVLGAGGNSQVEAVNMRGHLTTSSTSGSIQLKWAQNASSGTATIMRIHSNLTLQRVA